MDFGADLGDCAVRTEIRFTDGSYFDADVDYCKVTTLYIHEDQADERLRPARRRPSTASVRKRRSPLSFSAPLQRPLSRFVQTGEMGNICSET